MQHLKGKVKGEAERLIQHLNISAENYETAWDILTHRYNNPQILFSTQMELCLSQPSIHKQSSYALKKLHDTTAECINGVQNLGIDVTTWDPLLVHLLSKKLDDETLTDYMESRQSPRDLASYAEFMRFLENKFMALESVSRKDRNTAALSYKQAPPPEKYQNGNNNSHVKNAPFYQKYQAVATHTKRICPVCKSSHELYQCTRFLNQPADAQLRTIAKHNVCQNCLYRHYENKCISTKRCKECNGDHKKFIHDAAVRVPLPSTSSHDSRAQAQPSVSSDSNAANHNVNYVASGNEEVLLTTVSLNIKSSDGSYINLRALLDQSLISENAAQLLGLKRQYYQAAVSGIGSTQKQSKGLVSLDCASIYIRLIIAE